MVDDRDEPIHPVQPYPQQPQALPPQCEAPYPPPQAAPAAPAGRMFSANAVGIATFLGSPIAGGIVLALNYRRLGRATAAALAVLASIAGTVGLVWLAARLPSTSTGSGVAIGVAFGMVGIARLLQGAAFDRHVAAGGKEGSSWLAAGIGLPFLVVMIAAIVHYGGGPDLGTKVAFGHQQNIYFKDGVTRAQAKAMGATFQEAGYFDGKHAKDVLVRRETGGAAPVYVVSLVASSNFELTEEIEQAARQLGDLLSQRALDGAHTRIVFVDGELELLATVP